MKYLPRLTPAANTARFVRHLVPRYWAIKVARKINGAS